MNTPENLEADFERALLALDRLAAARFLNSPDLKLLPLERVERLVVPALDHIGRGWEQGRVALSQVYMSGRICEDLVDALLPTESAKRKDQLKMALVVLDDYHLLGKRMVYASLRASGYDLRDYGRMDAEALVARTYEDGIELLLISALMLSSALRVAEVRKKLDRLDGRVNIVVGGAPFRCDEQLWREVGADAMGRDASEAVAIVAKFNGGVS